MKKVLIVGEFHDGIAKLNEYLSKNFDTQLCTDNERILKSMLQMYNPDLVLMDIEGLDKIDEIFFKAIFAYSMTIPLITYGPEINKSFFSGYYYSGQARHVLSPYTNEDLLEAVCREFNMDFEAIVDDSADEDKYCILVVDDNPVLLRSMRNMLQDKYRVLLATSAAQCMKTLATDKVDVIILDYEMPVIDGRQTLGMIRAEEELKDIPVIFLTGIQDKAHVDAVLDLKPAGYFIKPPVQIKIENAIEGILKKYEDSCL